jgi:alkylation response protein AidB-like acyl-CoA dehydrogenase
MATTFIDDKNRSSEEVQSLQVAEDSREDQWEHPSFLADLFMGKTRFEYLLPFPDQEAEDKRIGDAYVAKVQKFFTEKVDADEIDRTGQIPDAVMKGMADLGLFGLKIPTQYGGMGLSQINYLRALSVVMSHCASTAALLSAHQSIGLPQPLLLFGTEEQKKKYLPKLAKGAVSAFGLTEPEVGSDPAKLSTTATPIENGDFYFINGIKLWCTNSVIADYIVVMAQTPAIMVRGKERKQITAFIVDTKSPGFKVLHRCRFMGLNGVQNGLIEFKNVKVAKEDILWGLGKGLKLALTTLNAGRLSIPAGVAGTARVALQVGREWGTARKQWGAQIGKHEPGAQKLASAAANTLAMEAMTYLGGAWVDKKSQDIRLEAAMSKLFCSLRSHFLFDEILQLRGGRGYERAESLKARGEMDAPVERWLRDSRINQIVEGTNEIQRLFISREALDRHLTIAGAVLNPSVPIGVRLTTAIKAACFYAYWYPLQWVSICPWPFFSKYGKLGKHFRFVKRTSHRLARTLFHLMAWHGPKLEFRQLQLGRIVDIGTDLFAMSALLAKSASSKEPHHQALTELFCREARHRIRMNFNGIYRNDDKQYREIGKKILNGEVKWLEQIGSY